MDLSSKVNENIYRHNAFRIFNLSIMDSQGKIRQEFVNVKSIRQFGGFDSKDSLEVYGKPLFPITPAPNYMDYQNAKNRLVDSRNRFIEELFWFWPEYFDGTDESLSALKKADVGAAISIWNSSHAANASHNLAVYNHMMAIDSEIDADTSSSQKYWQEALMQWHKTLSSDDFKDLALSRVRQWDDPTIKEDYVDDIFRQFPQAVLSINASFAVGYYKDNNLSDFERHVSLIKCCDFDKPAKDEASRDIFDSVYESLNEKFGEFNGQEYDKLSDIPKIERFLASIGDDVAIIKEHFADEFDSQILRDKIADSVKGKYIHIINQADSFYGFDFNRIIEVFEDLAEMAYSTVVKDGIENNVEQLRRIMQSL